MTLGVRSLANASRARQFNPLNPPWGGVGTASSNKYGSRGRSCAVVHGRAWSCAVVRGRARSCAVVRGRARSCAVVRGRARSCVRGRSFVVVRGRARSVVRGRVRSVVRSCGRAWSCGRAVLPASRPALPCCPLRGQHGSDTNERTKERTTSNNPLNPPGVGWVNFCYPIKVRVSMGTCVPNLGAIRRLVRKFCLLNL